MALWRVGSSRSNGLAAILARTACASATCRCTIGASAAASIVRAVAGAKADQIALVLNGKPGTAMTPWKQLSDADLAAVITYTRNSWGNKTGDAVQPGEVKALRK